MQISTARFTGGSDDAADVRQHVIAEPVGVAFEFPQQIPSYRKVIHGLLLSQGP